MQPLVSVRLNNGVCMPVVGASAVLKNRLSLDTDHLAAAYAAGFRHFSLHSGMAIGGFREWLNCLQIDRSELFISLQMSIRDTRRMTVRSKLTQDILSLGCGHVDLLVLDVNQLQLNDCNDSLVMKYQDEPPATKIAKCLDSAATEQLVRAVGLSCHDAEKCEQILSSCKTPVQLLQAHDVQAVRPGVCKRLRRYCNYRQLCQLRYVDCSQKSDAVHTQYLTAVSDAARRNKKTREQVLLRSYLQQNVASIIHLADYSSLRSAFKVFDFKLADDDMRKVQQAVG